MKKKFLMVLLTVMAAFAVFTINASAATDGGNCGPDGSSSVQWSFDTTSNTLTISGTGEMGDFSSSTQPWAAYLGSIQSVIVEDGVTSIGDYAFDSCTALTSVDLPDSITEINDSAFDDCSALTSITLPDSITFLPSAFLKT